MSSPITPDPSIHNSPANADTNPPPPAINIESLAQQLLQGVLAQLLAIVTGGPAAVGGAVASGLFSWASGLAGGLETVIADLWTGWTGLSGSATPPTSTDLGNAAAASAASSAAVAAAVNALNAQIATIQGATSTATDAFMRSSSSLGSSWDVEIDTVPFIGGGFPFCDGQQMRWEPGGSADTTAIFRWVGSPQYTTTDTQEVALVLGTQIGNPNGVDAIDLHGRLSDDRQTSVRARVGCVGNNTWQVSVTARVSGVEHVIPIDSGSATIGQPAVGSTIKLLLGTGVSSRQFQVLVNDSTFTFTDSGAVSQMGASFRGRGFGVFAGGAFFFGQADPGAVAHWSSVDISIPGGSTPPPTTTYDGGDATGAGSTVIDGGSASGAGSTHIDGGTA